MGRRPNPLPETGTDLVELAGFLRRLRVRAGEPPYGAMSKVSGYAASVLSEAASGRSLPTLAAVKAYVRACTADPLSYQAAERWWRRAAAHVRGAGGQASPWRVQNPADFLRELQAQLHQAGLFGVRAIEAASAQVGCRVARSTVSRWLRDTTHVMPVKLLDNLLTAGGVTDSADRAVWREARTRAALATCRPPASSQQSGTSPAKAAKVTVLGPHGPDRGVDALTRDLRRLYRGRGLRAPDLLPTLGAELLAMCDLDLSRDDSMIIRTRLVESLTIAAAGLPDDLELVFRSLIGLDIESGLVVRVHFEAYRSGRAFRSDRDFASHYNTNVAARASATARVRLLAHLVGLGDRTVVRRGAQAARLAAEQLLAQHRSRPTARRTTPA